jgi:hypothetical protein
VTSGRLVAGMPYASLTPMPFDRFARELAEYAGRAGIETFELELYPELEEEHVRNPRRFAQVTPRRQPPRFEFAPQVLHLGWPNRLGLIVHEIGHVLAPEADEDGADRAGSTALQIPITYDMRWPGKGLQIAFAPYPVLRPATIEPRNLPRI